jgi:hypothetical protein
VATTRERRPIRPITEETRAEDEKLREKLRNADISKFKRTFKQLLPSILMPKARLKK